MKIDQTRVSAVYKSGFLARLNNLESFSSESSVYEWGKENTGDFTDDVVFRSILDTQLSDISPSFRGTIRETLTGTSAEADAVKAIKDWVNLQRVSREPLFSRELATGIYYGAIAASLVHHDVRISSLQDRVLIRGFESAAGEDWMDPELRATLMRAAEVLS